MKVRNKHIDMIEKYLDNQLDERELKEFDEMMEDREFRDTAEDMGVIVEGIKRSGKQRTKDELLSNLKATLKEDGPEEEEEGIFKMYKATVWKVAASISVIAVVSFFVIRSMQPMSNEQIYAEFFAPAENNYWTQKRSGADTDSNNDLNRAFLAYENENYSEAASLFEKIPDEGTTDPEVIRYFIGVSYMAAGNVSKAIPLLRPIAEQRSVMQVQAQWYLGLAYIKIGLEEQAVPILEKLSNSETQHAGKAQKILEELK